MSQAHKHSRAHVQHAHGRARARAHAHARPHFPLPHSHTHIPHSFSSSLQITFLHVLLPHLPYLPALYITIPGWPSLHMTPSVISSCHLFVTLPCGFGLHLLLVFYSPCHLYIFDSGFHYLFFSLFLHLICPLPLLP